MSILVHIRDQHAVVGTNSQGSQSGRHSRREIVAEEVAGQSQA